MYTFRGTQEKETVEEYLRFHSAAIISKCQSKFEKLSFQLDTTYVHSCSVYMCWSDPVLLRLWTHPLFTGCSGYPEIRISGNPDIRKSGYPDFRISDFSNFRKSGSSTPAYMLASRHEWHIAISFIAPLQFP